VTLAEPSSREPIGCRGNRTTYRDRAERLTSHPSYRDVSLCRHDLTGLTFDRHALSRQLDRIRRVETIDGSGLEFDQDDCTGRNAIGAVDARRNRQWGV
jgi:hypothetical protein